MPAVALLAADVAPAGAPGVGGNWIRWAQTMTTIAGGTRAEVGQEPGGTANTTRSPRRGLGGILDLAGQSARTTPGRLRLTSLTIVAVAVLLALATVVAVNNRRDALDRAVGRTEPLVVAGQEAHAALVAADAAAAAAFLSGGVENRVESAAYDEALARAARELQTAAERTSGDSVAQAAIRRASTRIPTYAGLVERARANNRLGFPIGAAYLRAGSDLMHDEIVPAVEQLAAQADKSLEAEYESIAQAVAVTGVGLFVLAALVVVLLVHLQRFLSTRMHRTLNPPLIGATAIVIVAGIWVSLAFLSYGSALADARSDGYRMVAAASRARTTAFDARADESLALIARGNGARFNAEFDTGITAMDGHLANLRRAADGDAERGRAEGATAAWHNYLRNYTQVRQHVETGDQIAAVTQALGPGGLAFAEFDRIVGGVIAANQDQFETRAAAARRSLSPLTAVVLAGGAVVVALTMAGVNRRLAEYR